MPRQDFTTDFTEVPIRRRGRPTGKNRTPLSLEERRARNAQYERERRCETSEAMAQLCEAAGCPSSIPNADLIATVVTQLQRAAKRDPEDDIEQLRRTNEDLMQQIAELEQRLGWSEINEEEKENIYQNNIRMEPLKKSNIRRNVNKQRRRNKDDQINVSELKLQSDCGENYVMNNEVDSSKEQWAEVSEVERLTDFETDSLEINQWPLEDLINEYL